MATQPGLPVPCAGGIVFDAAGRLLLIERATPPGRGLWSVPGGRCLPGESPADACVREVEEETGLLVRVERRAGRVERAAPAGASYDITDFVCAVTGGSLRAADDANDARWVTSAELAELPVVPGLVAALAGWECLPRV